MSSIRGNVRLIRAALVSIVSIILIGLLWKGLLLLASSQGLYLYERPMPCLDANLSSTTVSPYTEVIIERGNNIVWCGTTQIAWNYLCDYIGENIVLKESLPLIDILNKHTITNADINMSDYVVMAGNMSDVNLEKTKIEICSKFGHDAVPYLLPTAQNFLSGELVAYSCLVKNLPFEWAFERLKKPLVFKGSQVVAFGIDQYLEEQNNEKKAATQVLVYDFLNPDDFIIELKTGSGDDRLFLAKIRSSDTLYQTIQTVINRVHTFQPQPLHEGDNLVIPIIDFNIYHEYSELYGKPIQSNNPKFQGAEFGMVGQLIRFKLDEKGAKLKSESLFATPKARNLVFDKPFLVFLQRNNAKNPYFALWVANAELLLPFKR